MATFLLKMVKLLGLLEVQGIIMIHTYQEAQDIFLTELPQMGTQ